MKYRINRILLNFSPCIFLIFGWFIWNYASVHEDSTIGIITTNIVSEYHNGIRTIPSILSLTSNRNYFDDLDIVEMNMETDVSNIKTMSSSNVELVTKKNNVADLSNWVLPITGNYTITTYYETYHRAIDYYSYNGYGSDILAVNNGTIYSINMGCSSGDLSCNGRRGNYLVINHNNGDYYTLYMHLNEVYVNVGDDVSSGDVIASMGNTGYVIPAPTSDNPYGGTHLHIEVYIGIPDNGGYTINPLDVWGY